MTLLATATRTNLPWSTEEDNYLRNHYPEMSAKQVGEKLGRSKYDVRHQAQLLNLTYLRPEPWGLGSEMTMRKCYGSMDMNVLSALLGRSKASIEKKAREMNLKTSFCY